MTVNPSGEDFNGSANTTVLHKDANAKLARAYLQTYQGPHGDAPSADSAITAPVDQSVMGRLVSPGLLTAHSRLGGQRRIGETKVAVYGADDAGGFGPALQLVTDQSQMLMDSVTVLLHRQGVAYVAIMNPTFRVRRDSSGQLVDMWPAADPDAPHDGVDETWIHVALSPSADTRVVAEAAETLPHVLADARQVAVDSAALNATLVGLANALDADRTGLFPSYDRRDVAALLRWLADGHFVLLGYQRCAVRDGEASVDPASRLGVLRLRTDVFPQLTGPDDLLVLAQATMPSFLRYGAYPYIVVVRENHGGQGQAVEHRFVGLFTVAATNANVLEIPLISRRVHEALALAQGDPSHPGQLMLDIIQTIPRSELFALSARDLLEMARAVVDLGSRRRALLFLRADQLAHFVSRPGVPAARPLHHRGPTRDAGHPGSRARRREHRVHRAGQRISLGGSALHRSAACGITSCRHRYVAGQRVPDPEPADRGRPHLGRPPDRRGEDGIDRPGRRRALLHCVPRGLQAGLRPADAIGDIAIIEELQDNSVKLVFSEGEEGQAALLTWYLGGRSASLSELLPMLQSMGVVVLEERPFTVTRPDGLPVWIYQFKIALRQAIAEEHDAAAREATAARFADAVTAIWQGRAEIDRFNELVLRAGLTWQQVTVLRSYAKYLRQAGFPYSQSLVETVVNDNPHTARSLVELFEALFDPSEDADHDASAAAAAVAADIDALVSLDTDRVLRAFASMIQATLRTNYFVTRPGSAREQNVLSVKVNPGLIDELPLPRPKFEIFVYSPRVEGVHLRFGYVARGGLRWSDRREDFRTEILGLVKAQAVKNAVIVPVGAKGGFVLKSPPAPTGDAAADRDAQRAEGVACYRLFISGLLDITDNVDTASGAVVAPAGVVRRDGDDAYLVVAADKGTATFSDIANDVAKSYGFWLGDAFASGGSVGYDHKAMGITAKGAWESVKRHFREMGIDTQSEDFIVTGVGDMSGDVFGNGMLLSKHIRLIAAFDHRHIFLDPDPDAASSWVERKRMFELPRSSWDDYDRALISEGGGVFSREAKSIPISPQVREALALPADATEMTPPALMKAIMLAPTDLFWNGGIGTYIKAETESDADVGDRANDSVRVNGNQMRAKVIGEGGNLGVTQRGRIEFELAGGHVNTDALDNSAGVDCSDHEVNIKILVDSLVTAGKVSAEERTDLLMSMTDEVGLLVLEDNAAQNDLMGTSRANAASLLTVHARQIKQLVTERGLNRELEALPAEKEIRRRTEVGVGLTSPELVDADGAREAGAEGRAAGRRTSRSGGVRRAAARVLPASAARPLRPRDPHAPAASGDRHDHAGQRPRRHRGDQLRLPRLRGRRRRTGRCGARVRRHRRDLQGR